MQKMNNMRYAWEQMVGIACMCILGAGQAVQAQTDRYMIEVVEEEAPGIEMDDTMAEPRPLPQSVTMRMPGKAQVGSRGRGSDRSAGANTMLRYDQHREVSPPTDATIRIGPFYSNLGIGLSAGYRYTRFSGQGQDFLDGTRRGEVNEGGYEFPLTVRAQFDNYMILTPRMDLSVNVQASYFYYPLGTQEDAFYVDLTDEGIFATFSTQFQPGRNSRIFVYDDILYLTDYIDTRGFSDRLGGREYKVFENTVGADWDWQAGGEDVVSASVSRSDTIPQSDEFDRQRAVRYREMGMYRRQMNRFSAAGIVLNASQSLGEDGGRPDSSIYGAHAFTGLQLTRSVGLDVALGQQFSRVDREDTDDTDTQDSLYASIALNHDLPGTKSQRLSAQRSIAEAFDGGVDITDDVRYAFQWGGLWLPGQLESTYRSVDPQDTERTSYEDWSTTLTVKTQLTRRIPLRFSATYAFRFNDGRAPATDATGDEEDVTTAVENTSDYETLTLALRTGFRVTERIRCSAYAQHAARTSDNPDLEFARDSLGITLTWGYSF